MQAEVYAVHNLFPNVRRKDMLDDLGYNFDTFNNFNIQWRNCSLVHTPMWTPCGNLVLSTTPSLYSDTVRWCPRSCRTTCAESVWITAGAGFTYSDIGAGDVSVTVGAGATKLITGATVVKVTEGLSVTCLITGAGMKYLAQAVYVIFFCMSACCAVSCLRHSSEMLIS